MDFVLAAVAIVFAAGGLALAYPTGVLRGSITAHADQRQRRRHALVGALSAVAVVVGGAFAAVTLGFYLNGTSNLAIALTAAIPAGIVLIILLLFISSRIAESSEDRTRNQSSMTWRGASALARAQAYNSSALQPPVSGAPSYAMPGSPAGGPPPLPVDMRPGWVYHAGGEQYVLALGPSAAYPQGAVVELPGFTVGPMPTVPLVPVGPIEIQVLPEEE
ncbi:hypothetical protein [Fodinicola acaciae]|uniref:hypothetical protein n=1 Tax=Fodinicola acaciae TaxID=2681555 RepID=UPI0013D8A5E2|nr:hypothetical protein [Fodinicola acaciae]